MDCARAASSPSRLLRCASLQRDGPKRRFIPEQVRFLFEGLTNGAGRSGANVCVENITGSVVVGEVATAGAIEVREERRLGIRGVEKRMHLGTGCSPAALSQRPPAPQQKRRGKSSDPETWSVSCLRAAPAQEREE